jgi:hypothetical protein
MVSRPPSSLAKAVARKLSRPSNPASDDRGSSTCISSLESASAGKANGSNRQGRTTPRIRHRAGEQRLAVGPRAHDHAILGADAEPRPTRQRIEIGIEVDAHAGARRVERPGRKPDGQTNGIAHDLDARIDEIGRTRDAWIGGGRRVADGIGRFTVKSHDGAFRRRRMRTCDDRKAKTEQGGGSLRAHHVEDWRSFSQNNIPARRATRHRRLAFVPIDTYRIPADLALVAKR